MEINFESNKAARALFDKDLDPIRILRDISIITDKEIIPGRNSRGSEAEVDYIIQNGREIIPVEVKSGKGSTLKSMQLFLKNHQDSPYGIRFSTNNYSVHEKIHSYPLYAIANVIAAADQEVKDSLISLTENSNEKQ